MSRNAQAELLLATKNRGKVRELTELLAGIPLRLRNLAEFPSVPTPEETGATFAENAELKARFYAAQTGLMALADDSGLEADALGAAPGVHSARYAGENATDEERVALLLAEMRASGVSTRRARFVCAVALFDPRLMACELFEGTCEGRIGFEPRGSNGFGYDPVFIPDGFDQTFAQLHTEIKQRISHRAQALRAARLYLAKAFPLTTLTPGRFSG
ncbi:MAG: RdgB/HAM1 family non-canonical purine NTP pyrophosphatase [Acidobacteria bacterium]|nr:RdgB/HAM1 family non-canonical purine NTP pyrophosphatase [Acidobacteriota bacterium]